MKHLYSFLLLFALVGCKVSQSPSTYIKSPGNAFDYFQVESTHFPLVSVHRGGGETPGIPENCLESFQYFASKMPSIIECDIVMSKDSVLYMMHDNTLERTTTGSGKVTETTWDYVRTLSVKDNFGTISTYKVPTLSQTLNWGRDKVLFTLDVKRGVPFEKVVSEIREAKAENYSVVITYNATDAKKVYDLNPNLLISVGIMKEEDYQRLRELGIPDKNMVAFIGTREPSKELIDFLHQRGIITILGVLGNLDKKAEAQGDKIYRNFIDLGVDILSTDRPEAVYKTISTMKK